MQNRYIDTEACKSVSNLVLYARLSMTQRQIDKTNQPTTETVRRRGNKKKGNPTLVLFLSVDCFTSWLV